MDKPTPPKEPIKPMEPTRGSIKPKKPEFEFSGIILTLFFIALAVGATIYAILFYTGNLVIPVKGIITGLIHLVSFTSGLIAAGLIILSIFFIWALISVIKDFSKEKKQYEKDMDEYNNNFDSLMAQAMKKYNTDMETYNKEYEEYLKLCAKYKKDLDKYYEYLESTRRTTYNYNYDNDVDNTETYNNKETDEKEVNTSGSIYDNSWSLIGFYGNGFVLDSSHSVIGEYSNGSVDYHGSLYGSYSSSGYLYRYSQKIGQCDCGTIYDEYGKAIGKYDGDFEGACAAAILLIFR